MTDEELVEAVARKVAPFVCRPVHNGDCDDMAAGISHAYYVAREILSTAEPLIRADERKRVEGEIVAWLDSHPEADEDFGPGFIVAASGVSTGDYRKGEA